MNENPPSVTMNLSENRKTELSSKVKAMMERYERSFGVRITSGEVIAIVDDMFEDNRKNFVKAQLGPITYADRDFLALLFKTKKAVEDVEKEHAKEREEIPSVLQRGDAPLERGGDTDQRPAHRSKK